MNEENNEKRNDQKNWLREHNSIQDDLFKMKDELISGKKQTKEERKGETPYKREDLPDPEISKKPQKEAVTVRGNGELTIKQILGEKTESRKTDDEGARSHDPPRITEGQIPTSPDLSNKIANVLLLEDKLKRRKFELERRSEGKKVPPPPSKPILEEKDEKKRVDDYRKEVVDDAVEEILTRDLPKNRAVDKRTSEIENDIAIHGKPSRSEKMETMKEVHGDRSLKAEHRNDTDKERKKRRGILALFGR